MKLFDRFAKRDIQTELLRFHQTPGALLLDVRSPEEYAQGHIPGSVNLPLAAIADARERIPNKDTPLFVYCLSGARSRAAASALASMGFTGVVDMGGMAAYRGAVER